MRWRLGLSVPILAKNSFVGVAAEGNAQSVVAQVVDVAQRQEMHESCNSDVFDSDGSNIDNSATSKIIWLQEDGNL